MGKLRFPLLAAAVEVLGDLNPQLLRELQGRLRKHNIVLTVVCSLIVQGLLLFWRYRALLQQAIRGTCATAEFKETSHECVQMGDRYVFVHWQEWWVVVFAWSSLLLLFGLVVGGSFMLISDLSKEERRGTLTFISLSPQSARTILVGKLLGVPVLLFFAAILALPLQFVSGSFAQIPWIKILCFDGLLVVGCLFFYSLALLVGLVSHWLNGFQAWLASAGLLGLLLFLKGNHMTVSVADWLYTFSPTILLPYVVRLPGGNLIEDLPFASLNIYGLCWFKIPIGTSGWLIFLFALANYSLWTGWLWQSLMRRFRNPQISLLSKQQSYGATACIITCYLGFSTTPGPTFEDRVGLLLIAHLLWFLLLTVLLLPQHQVLQDWARFRRGQLKDWFWADSSPVAGAIALNLLIANFPILLWAMSNPDVKHWPIFMGLLFNSTLILILALFNQVLLLTPLSNRQAWTAATLIGPSVVPLLLLSMLGGDPMTAGSSLFLFTPVAFAALNVVSWIRTLEILMLHLGAIMGLTLYLNRQLKGAGESTTARLFKATPAQHR